ncbi:MAG TPA: response regulator, partial [Candidatus Nanopelagicales bacterium]|nr:response regulator [Candidatus Nanopelagicales bacterium]
ERVALAELLGVEDVTIRGAASGAEAIEALASAPPDVLITGLDLPDMRAFELVDRIAQDRTRPDLPILVYAPGETDAGDEDRLARLSQAMVLKHVRSQERLLDEVSLFLHLPLGSLPESRKDVLSTLHQSNKVLIGKKVLIVDDDIRNIFAMTTLLEAQEMKTAYAETGRGAIDLLGRTQDVDVVLMDIMMPEMDGYDTIRAIRAEPRFHGLPIVAVTAKAMKGDREKCLEAGANDYISKPVDPEQLLAVLRLWLHR